MPWRPLSVAGLLLGTLFFAASLTPSLLPRPPLMQGLVAGTSLAAGYGVGVFLRWLWRFLEMPMAPARIARPMHIVAAVACALVAGGFLLQASDWQNSIRVLMDLDPVEGTRPFTVGLIAVSVFAALLALARLFRSTILFIAHRLRRYIPRRVSYLLGAVAAAALFWSVIDGVLFSFALRAADSSFQQVDALIEADEARPPEALGTGDTESLLDWADVGRGGRQYLAAGPTADDIGAFFDEEVPQPIRVYVGLNSAETVQDRARLALEELLRVGAFERSVLVIVTPTGTGWIDPAGMYPLEYLHRGDIASVAVQYSYLPSALSLMVEADYGAETARALFAEVYGYWTQLPAAERPELYLYGLSLGALNSDRAFELFDVVGDLFHGALWSGPPFRSDTWRSVTERRVPGTPAWLPLFRDGSVIRFTNQENWLETPNAPWGPLRIAYLQYASDPVTFFDPRILYREPDWLAAPRGPDVSEALRWFPIVTMLQLAADMLAGDTAPPGFGHVYAAEDYIDTWIGVTRPAAWNDDLTRRLKALFDRSEDG